MTRDVEGVAAKMTEAQRRALIEALGGDGIYLTRFEHGVSVRALRRHGLTIPTMLNGSPAALTPLGIEVRAHLLAQDKSQ